MKRTERDNLTTHLNSMDKSGSIRFTDDPEVNGSIPFLDALIKRNEDGTLKVMVYRKKIHTDQYLNLASHHPLQHKLGVIRTLYNCCDNVVIEQENVVKEIEHVNKALSKCGYPKWSLDRVKEKSEQSKDKTKKKKDQVRDKDTKNIMITLPYIKGVSESLQRVCK